MFLYAILIIIFPLLVSGVWVGRLCWIGQEPAVLAAVGDCLELFLVSLLMAGSRPAIICTGSTVVVPVLGSLRMWAMGNFCCRDILQIWKMVGQGLTVFAVGAGGFIFFLSPIISFFFFPLSRIDGWVTCGFSPFQHNLSDIGTLSG